jgi:hypothetical protein
MIEPANDCFDLQTKRLFGDTAYGSAEMLGWLVHGRKPTPTFRIRLRAFVANATVELRATTIVAAGARLT